MSSSHTERKLAAILFADIAGYTALMQKDELKASIIRRRFHNEVEDKVERYKGQVIDFYGDGALCIFNNPLEAIRCAMALQSDFQKGPKVPVRIGIHSGTVMLENDKIYGDSVNLASRVESMGIAGAILFSKKVRDEIKNQPDINIQSLGIFDFKNVEEPMEIFALANDDFVVPRPEEMKGKLKAKVEQKRQRLIPLLLVLAVILIGGFYFFNQQKESEPISNDAITVFPFAIKSASTDIKYLGNGMVDLICTKLEGVPNLIPIDPNRIFNQLKKENESVPTLEKATKISNALGAAEFILGSIIEFNGELQISASTYDTGGKLIKRESIQGQKSELTNLINSLTRALIADKLEQEGQELNSLAVMTSDNLPALKAYLEGEQAYRKTDFIAALDYFRTATDLDSTFALAWMRLYETDGWVGLGADESYLSKAKQYAEKLPPKWQDLLRVLEVFSTGLESNEALIASMLRKYGENPQFTNLMAEHLFHYNTFHGRPITEAKPWLEKTRMLDPGNLEATRHIAHLAYIEGDTLSLKKVIAEVSRNSFISIQSRIYLLAWRDSVSENELKTLANEFPGLNWRLFIPGQQVPDDPIPLLRIGQRILPYLKDEKWNIMIPLVLSILEGQEEKTIALIKNMEKEYPQTEKQIVNRSINPAYLIANREFLPYPEYYLEALHTLEGIDQARAIFASAKYAWVLNQERTYELNKKKLAEASQKSQGIINPARYYHWTLSAFEARQNKENEKALIFIDSAFQYTPASGYYGRASAAIMDKAFMLADIYEEQGEFEKAIERLENLPFFSLYSETKGYATYRLTQLYEKSGNVQKAIAKCDLFLKNYKNCDEKYRPWWKEVNERKTRLVMAMT